MQPVDITKFKGSFFRILQHTGRSQVAVMTVAPGQDSGPEEIHEADQIVYVVEGEARVVIGYKEYFMKPCMIATIPAGAQHHIYNSGKKDLFFITIYAPPEY